MAKRRLSKQQKRRINASKNELGRSTDARHELCNGLVIRHHGRKLVVLGDDGEHYHCKLRQNLGDVVCGDRVVYEEDHFSDDLRHGAVLAISPRSNLLEKTGFAGRTRAVAANLGKVVIVSAVEPALNHFLIDRYLVAVENLGAEAVLVINKSDLLTSGSRPEIEASCTAYRSIGYPVVLTSTHSGEGIEALHHLLGSTTSILVGLSGVGKSSLVKTLLPSTDIRIANTSASTGEGRHTTTVSCLYHLPGGGALIDSPGVRDFTPVEYSREAITRGFIEFRHYDGYCKFSNCTHSTEPGCAIREALQENEISASRYNSFRKLLDEAPD